jgi:hypothetical protein
MFTITREWIDEHRTARGGWSADQCVALGIAWPLQSGWKRRLIGKVITDEAKARFEMGLRARQARAAATLDLFR